MPRKTSKQSLRSKGLPKAAKQAAARAKGLGPIKAGRTKLPPGKGVKSGAKYAPGTYGPENKGGIDTVKGRPPKFGHIDRREIIPIKEKAKQYETKERFEAHKKKLASKKSPSLGISKRRSGTGTGAKKSIGYQGMRPGPLR